MERKSGKLAVLEGNCPICGRKLQDAWDKNAKEIWVICENPEHYLFFSKITVASEIEAYRMARRK